jgi:hypothetical protein
MKFVSFILLFFALFLTDCKKEKFTKEELERFKEWKGYTRMCCVNDLHDSVKIESYRKIEYLNGVCLNFDPEKLQFDFIFLKGTAKDFSVGFDKLENGPYFITINGKNLYFKKPKDFFNNKELSNKDGKGLILFELSNAYSDGNGNKYPIDSPESCQKALERGIIDEKESHEQTEIFQHHSGVNYEKYPPGKNPGEDPNSETPPE